MRRGNGTLPLQILDLTAALVVLGTLNGFSFGSTDDLGLVPFVFRWHDSALYVNDLRFGEWPNAYYMFHIGYMVALSKLMPIEWGLVLSSIFSQLLLLFAMQRLAERALGARVPAVLFALLMSGYFNSHLVGGYHLLSPGFSTHFVAIPLILLGMSYFFERRRKIGLAALLPTGIFNPRLGFIGGFLYSLLWYWEQDVSRRRFIAIDLSVACAMALAGYFGWSAMRTVDPATAELFATWMFVRAPWHYAPTSWGGFVFINVALVATFLVFHWRTYGEASARALLFVALFCLGIVLATALHNSFRVEPVLVISNPFQLGPFVLAIAYVFMAVMLMRRFARGRYLSGAMVLALPDLQSRLVALLLAEAAERWLRRSDVGTAARRWPEAVELGTVVLQIVVILVMLHFMPESWRQISYRPIGNWILVTAVLGALAMVTGSGLGFLTPQRAAAFVAIASMTAAITMQQNIQGIRIRTMADSDAAALCNYISAHAPVDAVFVVPPEMDYFQFDCRRSAFFTFTHLPLRLDRIPEWIARLKATHLVEPNFDLAALRTPLQLDYGTYRKIAEADFVAIGSRYPGVRYLVAYQDMRFGSPILFQDEKYVLYQIGPAAESQ